MDAILCFYFNMLIYISILIRESSMYHPFWLQIIKKVLAASCLISGIGI